MTGGVPVPASAGDPPGPTARVVRSFSPGGAAFSERALTLAGGRAMAPDVLPSTLPLDCHAELMRHVVAACRQGRRDGVGWLTLPPALLVARSGVGRLHAARQVARHAGLPHFLWDVRSSPPDVAPYGRDVFPPAPPTMAMLASGCANPVVSVVGADGASADALRALAEMVDPRTAKRWVDQGLGAAVDLSKVSWFVSWDEARPVPAWFERRFERIAMPRPEDRRLPMVLLGILDEVFADLGVDPSARSAPFDLAEAVRTVVDVREGFSAARLYERAVRFVEEWIAGTEGA